MKCSPSSLSFALCAAEIWYSNLFE
jgi:hypothetical protein